VSHTHLYPSLPGASGYGNPYGGVINSYHQASIQCLSTPYGYPYLPKDSYNYSSQVGTSTSYSTPHEHRHVHEHDCNSYSCGGENMNQYYPVPDPPLVVIVVGLSRFLLSLMSTV
jgi:hypothetical protein